jgi:hypothetical protein
VRTGEVRESMRQVDQRIGRPLVDGHDRTEALTDEELEAALTIAVAEPRCRGERLDKLLLEPARRRMRPPALALEFLAQED